MKQVVEVVGLDLVRRAWEFVRTFAGWWTNELLTSVPSSIRQRFLRTGEQLLVRVRNDTIETRSQSSPREGWATLSGAVPDVFEKSGSVAVLLPAGVVLRRVIELPLAAAATLHETASYQVGRITPFKLEEIRHVVRFLSRDKAKKTIRAEIAVVPRPLLEGLLSTIDAHGIQPSAILVDGDTSQPPLNFLPHYGERFRVPTKTKRTLLIAGGIALVLLSPFAAAYRLHLTAEASRADTDKAAAIARKVSAMQAKLDTVIRSEAFLPDRLRGLHPIEVLDELTRLIPDSTWVFRLEIRAGEATISGFSSDLPALLQELTMRPFTTPELASPVVQGLAGGPTRFELRVRYGVNP
jgi:general secretion pathway protein L